jgi:hypothetical protein
MQNEIQGVQVGKLKALYLSLASSSKVPLDAFGRNLADQDRVMLRLKRDQSNVGRITFVA